MWGPVAPHSQVFFEQLGSGRIFVGEVMRESRNIATRCSRLSGVETYCLRQGGHSFMWVIRVRETQPLAEPGKGVSWLNQ
jgi:hypothetical protein